MGANVVVRRQQPCVCVCVHCTRMWVRMPLYRWQLFCYNFFPPAKRRIKFTYCLGYLRRMPIPIHNQQHSIYYLAHIVACLCWVGGFFTLLSLALSSCSLPLIAARLLAFFALVLQLCATSWFLLPCNFIHLFVMFASVCVVLLIVFVPVCPCPCPCVCHFVSFICCRLYFPFVVWQRNWVVKSESVCLSS